MSDRTILPGAPGGVAPLVITPAVDVPADYPGRVTEAQTCLALIEPVITALAERIGTGVMPTARRVWEQSGAPAAVGEEFDARTGWRISTAACTAWRWRSCAPPASPTSRPRPTDPHGSTVPA